MSSFSEFEKSEIILIAKERHGKCRFHLKIVRDETASDFLILNFFPINFFPYSC